MNLIFSFLFLASSWLGQVEKHLNTQNTSNTPGPRWGHAFEYDPIRDQILFFGGATERGKYLGDTWVWDGNNWKQMNVEGPASRGFAATTFHQKRGTIILHGGRGNGSTTFSDTWEWNGRTWKQLEAESQFPADHHKIVYVKKDNKILGFGGWTGSEVSGKSWIWDRNWKELTQPGPPKRAAFGIAYDHHQEKVVLFGGLWINGQYADAWEWSQNKWQQLGGPYDHSSLDHHSMVYDSQQNQVLIFGGKNYRYVPQNKLMSISGNEFTELSSEGPRSRHSIGLTYNSKLNQVFLYGGKEYKGSDSIPIDDFWTWDGKQWKPVD